MANRSTIPELAEAIADGADVDWTSVESAASSDAERTLIRRLQNIGQVADHRRRPAGAHAIDPPRAAPDQQTTSWQWGPLSVLEEIGEGAFGEVYRAHDAKLARDVALKLLREAPSRSGRLSVAIEEGRLLARVRHPNVVTVYGADSVDGRLGIWMELLHGTTLEQLLKERGPFTPEETTRIGIDLCRALGAVHAAGLVHRDIKAQNVIREDDGRLVLMDFGTGREGPRSANAAENLAGTPLYLAPELIDGHSATVHSDIYSLGVLLYHLLTGAYPVTASSLKELAEAHRRQAPLQLGNVRGDLPEPLVTAIERATRPDPSSRYQDATEMETALARALAGAARRPSAKGAALVVAALLMVVAVAGVVWWKQPTQRTTSSGERVTTTSGEAARLYNDSYQLGYQREWSTALASVKQAVAADRNFALAHTWEAWCLRNTNAPANEVKAEGKLAVELSSRASEWERLWIEASYDRFTGETEREIAALKTLLKLRPDHYWALNNLDLRLKSLGRESEALPLLVQRANLRMDYGRAIYPLARALMRVGETDRALEFADWGRTEARQHGWRKGVGNLWTLQVEEQLNRGDVVSAAASIDEAKNQAVGLAAEGRDEMAELLAQLNLNIGRVRAAAEAADLAANPNIRHFNRAEAAFHGGDRASFQREMSLVASEAGHLSPLFFLIEAGKLDAAQWALDHIRGDPDALQVERAYIALKRGDRDFALSLLLAAHPPTDDTVKFELLSRLYLELGNRAQAITVLKEGLDKRPSARDLGVYGNLAHWWMRNELQLAELYHEAGRDAEARPLEEEMDKLLAAADPDFPLLVRLKALEKKTRALPLAPETTVRDFELRTSDF